MPVWKTDSFYEKKSGAVISPVAVPKGYAPPPQLDHRKLNSSSLRTSWATFLKVKRPKDQSE